MSRYRRLLVTCTLALIALIAALAGLTVVASASQRVEPAQPRSDAYNPAGLALVAAAPLTTPTLPAVTLTPSATPRLPRIRTFSLSARPDGPAQTIFPGGLSTIYARYEYYDFDVPHTVTIQMRDQYGIIFWRSDKSYLGAGTDVLTVTAQTVYTNYQAYVDNAASVMQDDLNRAMAANDIVRLSLLAQNGLGAAIELNTGLQQLIRYTPDSAIPDLAAAVTAINDAENEIYAAITPGNTLPQARARITTALAHLTSAQMAIDAVRAAGPNANVNSLPGSIDEFNIANIRIDNFPVQTIEWIVENPKLYRRIAAPIRTDLPNIFYILTLTNLSNANATLTVQYIPRGSTTPVFTQSVPLGAVNSAAYVIDDLAQLPPNFDGYAVISADVPFNYQVIRRAQTTPTPGGPTLTPAPATLTPTPTPTGGTSAPTVTVSPTLCPQPTPELLAVDPVTSPTDQLSQVVKVYIGNGDAVTITTVSGVFVARGNFSSSTPAEVTVALQPNATHDLTVQAHVRAVQGPGGCVYGNYTLTTTRDRTGQPLRIVQTQPTLPPGVTPTITHTPTLKPETETPTRTATATITPSPTLTPTPTPVTLIVTPSANVAGYVTGQDRGNNYLNTRILWTGIDNRPFTPNVLHGIFQFDLSALPANAHILSAEVTLVGVSATYLDPGTGGNWRLRLLNASMDTNWTRLNYYHIHNALADATSPTIVRATDLAVGRSNTFTLASDALNELEGRLRTTRKASFRLDLDSVFGVGRAIFGWDSRPTLRITYRQ